VHARSSSTCAGTKVTLHVKGSSCNGGTKVTLCIQGEVPLVEVRSYTVHVRGISLVEVSKLH